MTHWKMLATASCLVAAVAAVAFDDGDAPVRKIILNSRHMGAHGLGYNTESLQAMARKLGPNDIPVLIRLLKDEDVDVAVGAKFGLASKCGDSIDPVRRAAEKPSDMLVAEDILELVATNEACPEQVQQEAARAKTELDDARKAYYQKRAEELAAERVNDQRIQANGLKMLDPKGAATLTFEERLEVFKRSVKAAGLEDPKTPEQKALVDRMYRTMVLGESDNKKKPN
jgi:ribosomal 50S subunit-recycling heat shock protein